MAVAGKVAPVPKGDWNVTTFYEKLNIVSHLNCVYMAKQSSIGQEPVLGISNEYWMFLLDSSGSTATVSYAGKVKPDGDSIQISDDGTISTSAEDIGLGNLDNTADDEKTVKAARGLVDALDLTRALSLGVTDEGFLRVSWNE